MHPIYTLSTNGFKLLEKLECSGNLETYLDAYLCPAGKWTIGMGNTYYEDGNKVKKGDKINTERAVELFKYIAISFEKSVNTLVYSQINQNNFDALFSFCYNIGTYNFSKSTLLKMVNAYPNDVNIKDEWMKWIYLTIPATSKKQMSLGLKNRRIEEIGLYFKD